LFIKSRLFFSSSRATGAVDSGDSIWISQSLLATET